MDYKEAVDYLYSATPQFQQIGAAAYKPGLDTVRRLATRSGDSHRQYPVIHVAGTNGKGSTSHTIAAVLQSAGYRVGLFTSPHLVDFRERIRVDGEKISEADVAGWLEEYLGEDLGLSPSFFELTTVMAFDYFAKRKVDVAVIEVGLGGRLDSTNIVNPELSVITNISKDHIAQLGDSLPSIAVEKAGIIKAGVDVVVGEAPIEAVRRVFEEKARELKAPMTVAGDKTLYDEPAESDPESGGWKLRNTPFGDLVFGLAGDYQLKNANTVLHALVKLKDKGWRITDESVKEGFAGVSTLTGLRGRWSVVGKNPLIVCDTGHNEGGWNYISKMLAGSGKKIKMVIGFVNDKDVDGILKMMPREAEYFFTRASVPRALDPGALQAKAREAGLKGESYNTVEDAVKAAVAAVESNGQNRDTDEWLIFVGGSTFVVADLLRFISQGGSSLSR